MHLWRRLTPRLKSPDVESFGDIFHRWSKAIFAKNTQCVVFLAAHKDLFEEMAPTS